MSGREGAGRPGGSTGSGGSGGFKVRLQKAGNEDSPGAGGRVSPVAVVVELVVGSHSDEATPSAPQRIEDLGGSIPPHLWG